MLPESRSALDRFLESYNRRRGHQGCRQLGRTPHAVLAEGLNRPADEIPRGSLPENQEEDHDPNQAA